AKSNGINAIERCRISLSIGMILTASLTPGECHVKEGRSIPCRVGPGQVQADSGSPGQYLRNKRLTFTICRFLLDDEIVHRFDG
ncbi:MAG TPA: hypothetical protein VG324_27765, partial [Blastocatellia bacterium]|nr:hypothetical protein [Blastocatellia bacterium]